MKFRTATVLAFFLAIGLLSRNTTGFEQMMTDDGDPISFQDSNCFYYSLNENGCDDIPFDELTEATRWSFNVWEEVECSYFYFLATEPSELASPGFDVNKKNNNLLIWMENEEDWEFEDTEIAMTSVNYDANTGMILDVDIEFNGVNFTFANYDKYSDLTSLIDLKNTLVHEIGHTLGLAHNTDDPQATMYPTGSAGDTNNRTLEQDDMDGICHIYPIEEDPEVCQEPYCGLALTESDLLDSDLTCHQPVSKCGCQLPGRGFFSPRGLISLMIKLASHELI